MCVVTAQCCFCISSLKPCSPFCCVNIACLILVVDKKSTSGSGQRILRLQMCNLPLAVNEEPEVAGGEWQYDIKPQFCWNDHSCDCLLHYYILQYLWESSLLRLKRSFVHCYDFLRLRKLFFVCWLCWCKSSNNNSHNQFFTD